MSSLEKKKRKKTAKKPSPVPFPTPESSPVPSLPDDLLVSCFARVPRLYYPTLSLVSKSFRSLIASPELYETRSSLGNTESCLYVCLQFHPEPYSRWFTLCKKPDQILTNEKKRKKKKSSGYALAAVPIPNSRLAYWYGPVVVGSDIYNIGGPIKYEDSSPSVRSSTVSILDCRSNTLREAPSMQMERSFSEAHVLDGKIYVVGGGRKCNYTNWMEVFDPNTQAWEFVLSPKAFSKYIQKSAVIDGKVYVLGRGDRPGLAYKPKEGKWESVGWEMDHGWVRYSYGVIDNVLYYYDEGEFKWYDSKVRVWRDLKGVKGIPKFARYCVKMADYGGKMAVLWERVLASSGYKDKMILCSVIALERRNDEEIWGKVEWLDAVLTVPKSCSLEYAIAATV